MVLPSFFSRHSCFSRSSAASSASYWKGGASRRAAAPHNPATGDTVYPIVGWAVLFAIYLLLEYVGART